MTIFSLFLSLTFGFPTFTTSSTPDSALNKCIDVFAIEGGWCGDDSFESFGLKVKNICSEKLEVMIALQKADGTSDTTFVILGSGEISTRAYICQGTGRYKLWVRRFGSKEPFPTNQKIVYD